MEKARNAEEYIAQQREAIASNSECGTSHYNLGVALMGQRKYEEAEGAFHDAIGNSPSIAEAYVQLGAICLQRDDVEGCLYYNKQSTKARAGFSVGYGNIGFIEVQRGNLDEGIKNLEKAIMYNSKFVQAYTTLANAYMMNGELDKSIETSKKAIVVEPDFPIPYNNLAIAYLEKGDHKLAIENADKAVELGYEVAPEIMKEIDSLR